MTTPKSPGACDQPLEIGRPAGPPDSSSSHGSAPSGALEQKREPVAQFEELEREVVDLRAENRGLIARSDSLHAENWVLQRKLSELESENRVLFTRAEALQAESQRADQILVSEIHRLWTSRSWRFFRPLRNLVRRLRGYRRETEPPFISQAHSLETILTIHHSFSWELTAPLRLIEKLLPGRKEPAATSASQSSDQLSTASAANQSLPSLWCQYLPTDSETRHPIPGRQRLDSQWYDPEKPEVSVVILNFNKARLTSCCLSSLWDHTSGYRYEIVVVDNGSRAEEVAALAALPGKFRLVRLKENRFFGEANNIGAELALGEFLVTMNNDVLVTDNWLDPLIRVLREHAKVGGVGPKFLYPDGRLQEAGAIVAPDGSVTRRGEFENADNPIFCLPRKVLYCSAATLLLRTRDFRQVLGFDLTFDPAYYEDVDLCLKISLLGKAIYYCPDSTVYHLQNWTAADPRSGPKWDNLIEINREKFVGRWGKLLAGDSAAAPELFVKSLPASPAAGTVLDQKPKAVIFSPKSLVSGAGERHFLTIAKILSQRFAVTLLTPDDYSRIRLVTVGRELGVDVTAIGLGVWRNISQMGPLDLSVVITNALVPEVAAPAKRNLIICQFPFPASERAPVVDWGNWAGYQAVAVYSGFVRDCLQRAIADARLSTRPIRILPPAFQPVENPSLADWTIPQKDKIILNVGPFFAGHRSKRQDLLIDAFRGILGSARGYQLHLVGALHPEAQHRDYFMRLRELAKDLPVFFHLNLSPEQLRTLYRRALVYWHARGIGTDPTQSPEICEHFGLSVLEAMSAGAIPVVVNNGGPAETVKDGETGFHYCDLSTLRNATLKIIRERDQQWLNSMQRHAALASLEYSDERFPPRLWEILTEL